MAAYSVRNTNQKCVSKHSASQFGGDESGSVAVLFAFLSIILVLMAGFAVDVGRLVLARSALFDAADAAGLAAGRTLLDGARAEDAKSAGAAYFEANVKSVTKAGATISVPVIEADADTQSVVVNSSVTVPLTLLQLTGVKSITMPVRSEVRFDAKDLEVGVAIDVTGSMNTSINGERKIDSLKLAFNNFVDAVVPADATLGRKVRVAVAPYSSGINLGDYARKASNNKSKDGCVTERLTKTYTDEAPSAANGYFATAADGTKDIDPTQGRQGYGCAPSKIFPLSSSRDQLKRHVEGFAADGTTGGHFGSQWAWNLVSEDYATFWGGTSAPAPYSKTKGSAPKLIKAVIIMTDGVNNISFRHGKSRDQQIALCDAMKIKGVVVFSVGFGLDSEPDVKLREEAKDTLRQCATPGAEYFADASNAAQLDNAFKQFATVLGKLRVDK